MYKRCIDGILKKPSFLYDSTTKPLIYDYTEFDSCPQICGSMARASLHSEPSENKDSICMERFNKVVNILHPTVKNFLVFLLYRVVQIEKEKYPILRSLLSWTTGGLRFETTPIMNENRINLHLPTCSGSHSCLEQYLHKRGVLPMVLFFSNVDVILDDPTGMICELSDLDELELRYSYRGQPSHVKISFYSGTVKPENNYFSLCFNLTYDDVILSKKQYLDYQSGESFVALSLRLPGAIVNVSIFRLVVVSCGCVFPFELECFVVKLKMNVFNHYSRIPFNGSKSSDCRYINEYLLSNLVKDRGIIFENDPTLVLSKDISIQNNDFQKVYAFMYADELVDQNFNVVLYNRNNNCDIYIKPPTHRYNYNINEYVNVKWTIYTITYFIPVPLCLFTLITGKLNHVKAIMNVILSTVRSYDMTMYPEFLIFVKEFDKFIRDILLLPNAIFYPSATYRYLRTMSRM